MISTIKSHCFGSIFSSQIKKKIMNSSRYFPESVIFFAQNEKDYCEHEETIFPHCLYHKKCFESVRLLVLLLPISVKYAKCINAPSLLMWVVLYIALLCKCITPPIYVMHVSFEHHLRFFPWSDLIELKKKVTENFEILSLNRNCESFIALNHHILEPTTSNNYI